MLSYDSPLEWPSQPGALAECMIRRYSAHSTDYGARWVRLWRLGFLPADPGTVVYEAAESTVRTFYTDEEWSSIDTTYFPVRYYYVDGEHNDWLELDISGAQTAVHLFRTEHPADWPMTSSDFFTTQDYVIASWVVWRMTLLNIVESLLEMTERNWHINNPADYNTIAVGIPLDP